MARTRDWQVPLAFLVGAAAGGFYGYQKAALPGAVFGALAGGGLGVGLVWWTPIGMALVVILIAIVFLFMFFGAFWSTWLK